MIISGVLLKHRTDEDTIGDILLYIGIAVAVAAFFAMLPSTLSISTNAGIFHPTDCCKTANVEAILNWMKSPVKLMPLVSSNAAGQQVATPQDLELHQYPTQSPGSQYGPGFNASPTREQNLSGFNSPMIVPSNRFSRGNISQLNTLPCNTLVIPSKCEL